MGNQEEPRESRRGEGLKNAKSPEPRRVRRDKKLARGHGEKRHPGGRLRAVRAGEKGQLECGLENLPIASIGLATVPR